MRFIVRGISLAPALFVTAATISACQHQPIQYVALGDSFASMASLDTMDDSDGVTSFCMRSADDFPGLVAQDLGAALADATCQGATVRDVLEAHDVDAGTVPAQIESLNSTTQLVTVTIGGNDVAFGAPSDCAGDDIECQQEIRAVNDEALDELPGKLDALYNAIATRAPKARVLATGYLPLIAPADTCDYAATLSPDDMAWFQETTVKLNDAVRNAALEHGATYVFPDDTSQHTGCADPDSRWTSFDGEDTGSYPMHPTPAGQRAMAQAVVGAYNG